MSSMSMVTPKALKYIQPKRVAQIAAATGAAGLAIGAVAGHKLTEKESSMKTAGVAGAILGGLKSYAGHLIEGGAVLGRAGMAHAVPESAGLLGKAKAFGKGVVKSVRGGHAINPALNLSHAQGMALGGTGLALGGMALGHMMTDKESAALEAGLVDILTKHADWKDYVPHALSTVGLAAAGYGIREGLKTKHNLERFQEGTSTVLAAQNQALASNIEADLKNEDMLLREIVKNRMAIQGKA